MKLDKEMYLKFNGYDANEWTVADKKTAQKIKSNDSEAVVNEITDAVGVQNFGEGAALVKKADVDKVDFSKKESPIKPATPQEAFEVPKPDFVVPKPVFGKQEEPKEEKKDDSFAVPKKPDVIKNGDDHFIDYDIYNQSVVDTRQAFAVEHGAKMEGNNTIIFDKTYTPQQLFDLNSGEWDALTKELVEANGGVNEERFNKASAEIDKVFPPEDEEEKPKVTKLDKEQVNNTKVKMRIQMLTSCGMEEEDTYLKKGSFVVQKESLAGFNTEEFADVLEQAKLDYDEEEVVQEVEEIQPEDVEAAAEKVDDLKDKYQDYERNVATVKTLGYEYDEKNEHWIKVVNKEEFTIDNGRLYSDELLNEVLDKHKKALNELHKKSSKKKTKAETKKEPKTVEINKEEREARKEKQHVSVSKPQEKVSFDSEHLKAIGFIEEVISNYKRLVVLEKKMNDLLDKKLKDESISDGEILDKILEMYGR